MALAPAIAADNHTALCRCHRITEPDFPPPPAVRAIVIALPSHVEIVDNSRHGRVRRMRSLGDSEFGWMTGSRQGSP
ncbi:hypothetical protein GCM10010170_076790 [Dactylosporangium salmoneum]|uniref:Uncharacterized protein n=1 Tax=Dactylosporangium salmoneum TaxID=53361 RepID=A0ABN3HAC9_9ACTN